jgi:hypothetical protein
MSRILSILVLLLGLIISARAQQNCVSANFNNLTTNGWTLFNGSAVATYNNPSNCQPDNGGVITPGVGGNNPTKILSPDIVSNGSGILILSMDVFRLNSNLNCNTWSDFTCPTGVQLSVFAGGTSFVALSNLLLPQNGPGQPSTVSVNVNVQNQLPNGTVFKLEISFAKKTRTTSCIQNNTKYVIDNISICQSGGNTTILDAVDDNLCPFSTTNNIVSGNLSTNDVRSSNANLVYELVNGPYGNNNLQPGGANLTINSNGTFTLQRTDITLSIFDFTYRVTDLTTGSSDLASCTICIDDAGPVPVNLTTFNASRKNNMVTLSWKTAMESSLKTFDIERKMNGKYVSVGTVIAQNIPTGASYIFNDINNTTGISEYRLRITEESGAIKYSNIKSVSGINSNSSMTVYPNPSKGSATITVTDLNGSMSVEIMDYTGKIIRNYRNTNDGSITVSGLNTGIYLVRAKDLSTGFVYVQQLVVEK